MYPALARATKGRFHVKTAGTSYLEALRVVARHDVALFRRIIDFAREHYDSDKATYHVSATLRSAPPASEISDPIELELRLPGTLGRGPPGRGFTRPGRQILHCTFGSTLTDPTLGPEIHAVLEANKPTYTECPCRPLRPPPQGPEGWDVRGRGPGHPIEADISGADRIVW